STISPERGSVKGGKAPPLTGEASPSLLEREASHDLARAWLRSVAVDGVERVDEPVAGGQCASGVPRGWRGSIGAGRLRIRPDAPRARQEQPVEHVEQLDAYVQFDSIFLGETKRPAQAKRFGRL